MKFFFFHLMPYAHLDLDYDKEFEAAYITLPNSFYDPKRGHALYERYLDELELADALGFDGICVNEHHQTAYGMMPSPNLLAAALARRTARARICVLGRALPLAANPLVIAEEFAMLDNMTAGRFIAGFVRGLGSEYHASSVNPAFSLERFREAHDLIVRAWSETGPFHFEGKHYHFQYVNPWPRPYQTPHPPIWIPSQGSTETVEWAAHPDRKYTYLITYSPVDSVIRNMAAYRAQCEAYGYRCAPEQLGWAVPIYVAETDEIAAREARPHIEAFFNKFLRAPVEYKLPPGYSSMGSFKRVMEQKYKIREGFMSFDMLTGSGMLICGGPATVAERLAGYQAEMGLANLIATLQFATLPRELTEKNLRLFAQEVMPLLKPLGETPPGAAGVAAA